MSTATRLLNLGKVAVSGEKPAPGIIREGCQGGLYSLWKFLASIKAKVIPCSSVWNSDVYKAQINDLRQKIDQCEKAKDKKHPQSRLVTALTVIWGLFVTGLANMAILLVSALIAGTEYRTYLVAVCICSGVSLIGLTVVALRYLKQWRTEKRIIAMREELLSIIAKQFPSPKCYRREYKLIDAHALKGLENELEKFGAELGFETIEDPHNANDDVYLWRVQSPMSKGANNEVYYLGSFRRDEIAIPTSHYLIPSDTF